MTIAITLINHDKVIPNEWNPNKQTDRAFEAEIESLNDHGFVMPVTVRVHPEKSGHYQIIDGYHRWLAIDEMLKGKHNPSDKLTEILEVKKIPCVILDVSEQDAKKLTIILNETRGRAELGELGILLESLTEDFGDDLIRGLPYNEGQLNDLLSLGQFDWDSLVTAEEETTNDESDLPYRVVAELTPSVEVKWKEAQLKYADELPSDSKQAAGKLISLILDNQNTDS